MDLYREQRVIFAFQHFICEQYGRLASPPFQVWYHIRTSYSIRFCYISVRWIFYAHSVGMHHSHTEITNHLCSGVSCSEVSNRRCLHRARCAWVSAKCVQDKMLSANVPANHIYVHIWIKTIGLYQHFNKTITHTQCSQAYCHIGKWRGWWWS